MTKSFPLLQEMTEIQDTNWFEQIWPKFWVDYYSYLQPLLGDWWRRWGVMAASHCHAWWRWWSDSLRVALTKVIMHIFLSLTPNLFAYLTCICVASLRLHWCLLASYFPDNWPHYLELDPLWFTVEAQPTCLLIGFVGSSEFRELKKYQRDFSSWCGECLLRKKERSRCLSSAKRQLAS
jgi:hypothetical protein